MLADEIRHKYMPHGSVNIRLKGAGNGISQWNYEKKIMCEMLNEYVKFHLEEFVKQKLPIDLYIKECLK